MKQEEFKLGKIFKDFNEISNSVIKLLRDEGKKFKNNAMNIMKELNKFQDGEELIKLAFIGQYSAGKSTIISAITGNDTIKIDADIATDKTTKYEWNGNLLIDTPGLYTDKVDHDKITYEAIKKSDLLVYVITSDLFDNITLDNFKKLAYEKGYKNKMIMVVNKMSMEAGEFNSLKKNYITTLKKSLKPYRLSDFNISFIDAADFIEGKEFDIPEFIEMSNFNSFIEQLNCFVDKKGLLGSLESPIRLVISEIDKVIIKVQDNKANKNFFTILDRIENRVRNSMQKTETEKKYIISDLRSEIVSKGNQLAAKIGDDFDFEGELKKIETDIEKISQQKSEELKDFLENERRELAEEIKEVFESDIGQYFLENVSSSKINVKNHKNKNNFKEMKNDLSKMESIVEPIAGGILKAAGNPGKVAPKVISNTNLHKGVYKVGKFFGVNFKPWGAVKLSGKLAKFAKALGPILVVVSTVIDVADTVKASKEEEKMVQAKNDCMSEFISIASDIENQFNREFRKFKNTFYLDTLNRIAKIRKETLEKEDNISNFSEQLINYKEDLSKLISKIYI